MKKYLKLFFMLFLLYIPSVVYGDTLENFHFSAVASNKVVNSAGDETTIKISLSTTNTQNAVTGCKFKVNASGNSEIVSLTGSAGNGWKETSGQEYSITSNEGVKATSADTEASTVIGNVVVKVNGETKVTFSDITCFSADNDSSGSHENVEISLKVADNIVVKIDGSVVPGGIWPIKPSTKESFLLSVTSRDADTLSNTSVKAINTLSGEVLLCDNTSLGNCTVNFTSNNFCVSGELCAGVHSEVGDIINVVISDSNNSYEPISFFVSRELDSDEKFYNDASLTRLNVFGSEITLIDGQNDYNVTVPGNQSSYSVTAILSDPEHYKFDDEDNPEKYNFRIDTVNLLVVPKDDKMLGAVRRAYTINVTFLDENSSSDSQQIIPPPSSSVKPSSSTPINPQTGGLATFFVAFILFGALIVSLRTYNRNMG